MHRAILTLAAIALLLPGTAGAQRRGFGAPPPRPRLPAGTDTNIAAVYYVRGNAELFSDPERAAAAFYWASRLDPANAEAIYARRVALLLSDPRRLRSYIEDDTRRRPSAETTFLDSLQLRANYLNPFIREDLEARLITRYVEVVVGQGIRFEGGAVDSLGLSFVARNWLREAGPLTRARFDYCEGRYDEALRTWSDYARRHPRNSRVHAERARAFYHAGSLDSARVAMQRALEIARRSDADSVHFVYESKAAWEYALGHILDRLGDSAGARAAFERSVIEDLSYFPAHLQLGRLHLAAGDSAAAMLEFERAVQSAEHEYLPRATYGYRLATRGQLDSAAIHLRRAAEIEPYVAEARLLLGVVLDAQGERDEGRAAFEAFVALSRRDDPRLERVRGRLAQASTEP